MERRDFLFKSTSALLATSIFPFNSDSEKDYTGLRDGSASFSFDPSQNIIPAPKDPALWPGFREQLSRWREDTLRRFIDIDTLYNKSEFAWAASSYVCYFLMIYDESFYNPKTAEYTVESLLDEGVRKFGGYDSVVLWHAYPRIGVDQRNQFDFYRDMPGGLDGVRDVVHTCQKRGVRVYINYNPWDTGTRREDKTDLDLLTEIVLALDVDGIFLDTMNEGSVEFRSKLDAARPGVVLEGEGTPPLERIRDHQASWAQHFDDSEVPGVLRIKWLERRHMQHQIRRWKYEHSGELQTAWMNGSGMMVWENVFGSWVPWNARDCSLLRSMLPILRRYTTLFSGEGWKPLVPVEQPDVYASEWTNGKIRLWTIVNRSANEVEGALLKIDAGKDQQYFDLITGSEIKHQSHEKKVILGSGLPARGMGCFIAAKREELGKDFQKFLATQAEILTHFDPDFKHPKREVNLVPVVPTAKPVTVPTGMIAIRTKPAGELRIQMRTRECGFYESMTENEEGFWSEGWKFHIREFKHSNNITPYAIDETPVTNEQFSEFLKASHYQPDHARNFLKHWENGNFPAGKADHPVVWVDLDDARAYAKYAGKRLPTEEEWQYAAQGDTALEYPWGNFLGTGYCNLGESGDTTPVWAFRNGRSPFGCYDMCGNVWQWTESERTDGRTRFCIIRGGSYFLPKGSVWYVDGGVRATNFATKFLLMWPGLDRCATIGFRCAVDL